MAGERYRHIFLAGPTGTQRFKSPRTGGSSPKVPQRDGAKHSNYLRRCLEETWRAAGERQAVTHTERLGAYIEFLGQPNFDLAFQSLEDRRSGVRLQNVRVEGPKEHERTVATVYVPHAKRGGFLKKLKDYEDEGKTNKKTNTRKNATLINSIEDIRLAVLESFWRPEERALVPDAGTEWVEVWINSDKTEVVSRFDALLATLKLEAAEGVLAFPERSVKLIRADRAGLEQLIERSDDIAEFRLAKELAIFYVTRENAEQAALVQELLARCTFDDDTNVAVCLLDSGVNKDHSLIQPVLADTDLHTVREEWGTDDLHGHGTRMAGMAAYGDLLAVLSQGGLPVRISHRLESAKILPPPPAKNPKELWGFITAEAISRARIQAPLRKRVICIATTTEDDRDHGRPSSWSGEVDSLSSGYADETKWLIIVSAGNLDANDWLGYPAKNLEAEVHDPGQAWNALTVGAFTEKTRITDPKLSNFTPIALSGGLSPYSTTSNEWPSRKWPIKPDVVFEGGNVARGPNDSKLDCDDLQLLSTFWNPQVAQFAPFSMTSAAAAQAARMAAQIQVQYPDAWPETVRALMVHAAEWTDTMRGQFLGGDPSKKGSYMPLLRTCGYGVPNLDRALYCLSNSLTLISQARLQPFDLVKENGKKKYATRDMHLYNLPWPKEVLSDLGETLVTMRVTLSYFVEPSPSEVGWEHRYRYASHALRFDVNGHGESEADFVQRVNKLAREDGERPGTEGIGQNWTIGEARNVGSIHSDMWRGRAADLAASNLVAVYPAVGWWRERNHLNRWNRKCRYALVVSIYTPAQAANIYVPVATQIGLPVLIEISVGT